MKYHEMKRRCANPTESVFYSNRYAINNEFGVIAFVHANDEQDAIDIAADSGHLNCMLMADSDYLEYRDNGWTDSYVHAGNASEAYWSEYLGITDITK